MLLGTWELLNKDLRSWGLNETVQNTQQYLVKIGGQYMMDAFANTRIPKKVGEFLWLTSKMSPSLTGKRKIADILA